MAACFLPRRQEAAPSLAHLHIRNDASPPGAPAGQHYPLSAVGREDLFVIHSDGVLVRHCVTAAAEAVLSGGSHGGIGSPGSAAAGSSFGSTPDSVLGSGGFGEERQAELIVEAEEQWDLCRRRSWAERCAPPLLCL